MSLKPLGGRGKKAPYKTSIMRIPNPLVDTINKLVTEYHEKLQTGQDTSYINTTNIASLQSRNSLLKNEAIDLAKKILTQKKSARISLTNLLQVLYKDKNIKL